MKKVTKKTVSKLSFDKLISLLCDCEGESSVLEEMIKRSRSKNKYEDVEFKEDNCARLKRELTKVKANKTIIEEVIDNYDKTASNTI